MTEKILNIALIAMFATFCVVFAIKTVLIDVVKDDLDKEWEANKDDPNYNQNANNVNYTLTIDSRYNK